MGRLIVFLAFLTVLAMLVLLALGTRDAVRGVEERTDTRIAQLCAVDPTVCQP